MLRGLIALVWLFSLAAAGPLAAGTAKAQKGVALIIGQSNYEHLPQLPNPANDARKMDDMLRALGFETTVAIDLGGRKLARALSNFIEDAEGADVAVIYYSGHGIEAGGENWLLPVDVDVAALNQAEHQLVGLSGLIADLSAAVPLTLVFLDACRTNPFPPGTKLIGESGETLMVSAAGLGNPRGMTAAGTVPVAAGLGTLIGFAAEPGRAALDGEPGGNSPYAAALIRHLSAMNGSEVGIVMRMVTEEVYLKTSGLQRPWVNETLTRLVYLGAQRAADGDAGRILSERRQLLVTITGLSATQRQQVEAAAQTAAVPMDALYGLLRSLGTRLPREPAELDKILTAEAARVKQLLQSQNTLQSQDPEIARLADLARQALEDGALDAYLSFWQQAKDRFTKVAASLDDTEANLRARRLEGGEVLANTAAAYELKADYVSAAQNYALAFAQVAKWDEGKAWEYKRREADVWLSQGDERGDDGAVAKSIAVFEEALVLAPRQTAAAQWAWTQNNLGNAFLVRSRGDAGTGDLERAIAAYRAALEERPRGKEPRLWAKTQNNLAAASAELAERTGEQRLLNDAVEACRAALSETPRDADPLVWATLMSNLGTALERQGGPALEEAIASHRLALEERSRARVPLLWAASQENIGNALASLGSARADAAMIASGIAAYRLALEVITREALPLGWAGIQYNLGNALGDLGEVAEDTALLVESVASYRLALAEETFERTPQTWSKTQYMLGQSLWLLGERSEDTVAMRQAVEAYRHSLRFYARERNAADWAITEYELGTKLRRLGGLLQDTGLMGEAVEHLRQAISFYTHERNAADWADTAFNLAGALAEYAFVIDDRVLLQEAIATYRAVLEVRRREAAPLDWAAVQVNLGSALYYAAVIERDAKLAREGRAAVAAAAEVYEQHDNARALQAAEALISTIDTLIAKLPP